jgi:signal transduction histidine kinase
MLRLRALRGRIAITFGLGALLVSTALAASTYFIARSYLLSQRERSVIRQSYADADLVRDRLGTAGADVQDVITAVDPAGSAELVVRHGGEWYSTSLDVGRESLPNSLRSTVAGGAPAHMRTRLSGSPVLVVGLPLPAVDASFYEIRPFDELEDTLRLLAALLATGTGLATLGGTAVGIWASRKVLHPLNAVATTAAEISGGSLETRLSPTNDPDLATIVGAFNTMVDSLQQRIEQDARFAGDVSHELRSPLTTLITSVDVLKAREDELPAPSRQALELIDQELARFRVLLDNLLELARAGGGLDLDQAEQLSLRTLVTNTLRRSGRPGQLLVGQDVLVFGDRVLLERALANLFDNADRHGRGLHAVTVASDNGSAIILVDDGGDGVPTADRERIFERFATGSTARGSSSGTGLGLALVAETVRAHGGAVWCTDRPGGGARFVVTLPRRDQ